MKRNAVCSHTGIFYKKEVLYRVSVSAIYSLFLYNIAIRIKGEMHGTNKRNKPEVFRITALSDCG